MSSQTASARTTVGGHRLAQAASPYLRQHAHHPVDWYPWGSEALARARQEDKPIFLSIGYSACHWCHVMAHESFEDPTIAKLMNADFVCIKVDREERPDIDDVYMTACQVMTRAGGWPLSVFLTPELKPFFAGTYFPPDDRLGQPGFRRVVTALAALWKDDRPRLLAAAAELHQAVAQALAPPPQTAAGERPAASLVAPAVAALRQRFDGQRGGFGGAPKFPPHTALALLLSLSARDRTPAVDEMITCTLSRMTEGGVYDHVGGGFHRYSVDAQWNVPHFEKMLYDNALLARAYLEAWQQFGTPEFRQVAVETLAYLRREMQAPNGAFYASQDADSPGGEGSYYTWTTAEVTAALGEADARRFCAWFSVTERGNFEGGRTVLRLPDTVAGVAHTAGLTVDAWLADAAGLCARLRQVRNHRPPPGTDDKILAAWNGLAISAFATAYQVLGDPTYLDTAKAAADTILRDSLRSDGLLHAAATGDAHIPGFLDDYAALALACLDLYESTLDPRWATQASGLCDLMLAKFRGAPGAVGGLYLTTDAHDSLGIRPQPWYDGPVPAANALAAQALLRTGRLLRCPELTSAADGILTAGGALMEHAPQAVLGLLAALDLTGSPPVEIALVGPPGPALQSLLHIVHRTCLPNRVLAGSADTPNTPAFPLLAGKTPVAGLATAYVCVDRACRAPVTSTEALHALLAGLGRGPRTCERTPRR